MGESTVNSGVPRGHEREAAEWLTEMAEEGKGGGEREG